MKNVKTGDDGAEREAIVAWLREQEQAWQELAASYQAAGNFGPYFGGPSYSTAANAIECGAHLKDQDHGRA